MQPETPPRIKLRKPSFRLPFAVVVVQLFWMIAFPILNPGSVIQYPFFVYGAVPTVGTLILLGWFLRWSSSNESSSACSHPRIVLTLFGCLLFTQATLLDPSVNLARVFVFQPIITSAVVLTAYAVRHRPAKRQFLAAFLVLSAFVACTCAVRMQGMSGGLMPQFAWRWAHTNEPGSPLPDTRADDLKSLSLPLVPNDDDWPGFRGPNRDGVARDGRLNVDWDQTPPVELWRTAIGPGWSSFSVVGDGAFTQEQRGADEVISCRSVTTGQMIWTHAVEGRFEDSSSGPGPRSTPEYADGRLYALTANGILVALDASTGTLLWKQDLQQMFDVDVPPWGFASSPLTIQNQVVVFTGASDGRSVAAFDRISGTPLWTGGSGDHGYSSPQSATLRGEAQILIASNQGIDSLNPVNGELLWRHEWDIGFSPRIVQPCLLPDNAVILPTGYGKGTRRLQIEKNDEGRWSTQTTWTSHRFKPYFNDLVHHEGFLYGFDGNLLTCLDVSNGEKRWRKRGFGNGQVLLLQRQSLLVVLSEQGMVSLIEASESQCQIASQFQALEGKTWNHPVIRGSHLLVRNGTEAACFELMPDAQP